MTRGKKKEVKTACIHTKLHGLFQTVNIQQKRDTKRGVVNNQLCAWSFRLSGVLHDVSQENVYNTVAHDVVIGALEGYNGQFFLSLWCLKCWLAYIMSK